ncbi:MAG: LamG-like jellyroll fold domain-containing protein [bacterium]|nr:LamG-like jellyroll fold domain-containing protein [bacterium]
MKNKIYFLLFALFLIPVLSFGQATVQNIPFSPNGPIYCQKQVGSTLYVGGQFTSVNVNSGSLVGLNPTNPNASINLPYVNGTINTVVSDGAGGFLIGGSFSSVGGQSRQNFARINANMTLHPISIGYNGAVKKIVVYNNLAYVLGDFNYAIINGGTYQYKPKASSINLSNNLITSWAPNFSINTINDAVLWNNNLYLGGLFIYNGYRSLVALNLALSNPSIITTFMPTITYFGSSSSALINSLILTSGNELYFGGLFNSFNGQSRANIGAINLITNSPISNGISSLNGPVSSLAWNNNMLFVAGTFTAVNNVSKPRLFGYNTQFKSLFNSWTPNPNSTVNKVGVLNGFLWVSGAFNTISAVSRSLFAVYNLSTNPNIPPVINTLFTPSPNNTVQSIISTSSNIWIAGGLFNKISAGARNGVFAVNLSNYTLTSFAPLVNGAVRSIEVSGSNVFLGGSFSSINGSYLQNFGVVNFSNGALNTAYRANFNGTVNSILANGSLIYVGGNYTNLTIYSGASASSSFKTGICAINLGSSLFINNSFNTILSASGVVGVNVIKMFNGQLYLGGRFTSPRNALVSVNPIIGTTNAFNANINTYYSSVVNDLVLTPQNELAIGGYIPYVSGVITYNLAYLNSSTGGFLRSNSNVSTNEIMSLTNGNYSDIMYVNYYGLFRTQNNNGATSLAYSLNGYKYVVGKLGTTYFLGGNFSYYNSNLGNYFYNFMALNFVPPLPPTIAASNLSFNSITTNSMNINWSPGNGTNRIVMMRAGSPITSHPNDFNNYYAYNYYGSGSNIGGAFVVYNGNSNTVNVQNLQPGSTYYVKVVEYNGSGATLSYASNFIAGQQSTQDILPPTLAASSINAYSITKNSMYLNWVPGNGVGRIVIARQGAPVNAFPNINNYYYASNTFGSGSNLGQGNFVIANGNTYGTYLYNLTPGTTYHFAVIEYNQNGSYIYRYKNDVFPTANFTTIANLTEPTVASSVLNVQSIGGGAAQVSWTPGNGSHRVLMMNSIGLYNINAVSTSDGSTYTPNPNLVNYNPYPSFIGVQDGLYSNYGHRVVYTGTGSTATIYGLNSNTTYNFVLVEYNSTGAGSENYQQNQWAASNFTMPALVNTPNIPATNVKVQATSNNAARITWVNGNGSARILVAKQGGPVSWAPSLNASYAANSFFGNGINNSGNFVVYNGTGSSAVVSNLLAYTDYHFAVYEYNSAYNSYTYQNEVKYSLGANGAGKTQPANWPRVAGGNGTDAAGGVSTDPLGNVYVAGTYNGTANFGLLQVTGSSNQIFLSKYTSAGVLQWVQTAGGSGEDAASCVTVDNSGNSYIVGSFRNTAAFGTTLVTSNGTDDAFIAKYNTTGDLQWVRTLGGTGQDVAFWAKVDGNGDVVVTGYFQGNPSFSNSTQTLSSNGNSDIFVAKYSSNGNLVWSVGAGGNNYDYGHCVTIGANNSVIISGEYKTSASFGTTTLTNTGNESNGFIAKLSSAGGWSWATQMGGADVDAAYAVSVDATDNYYLVGSFSGTAAFGGDNLTSAGLTDGFVSRVNTNGAFQWTRQFGGISKDAGSGVSIAQNGSVYVAGSFANSITMNGSQLISSGNQDIVVAVYTQTGLLTQATKFGGNQNDQARGIHAIDNTATYICGYFEGTAVMGGFEVSASGDITSQLSGDMFVHNVGAVNNSNPAGDLVTWYKFNGSNNDFSGNNFHGTPVNSPVFVADRLSTNSSAISMNGTNYVNSSASGAPQYDNLGEITYSAWIKVNLNAAGFQTLLSSNDAITGIQPLFIYLNSNGQMVLSASNNGSGDGCGYIETSNYVIPNNSWTHVTVTLKSGNFIRIYINGSLVTPSTSNFTSNTLSLNNVNYSMGAYVVYSTGYYPYYGTMDDVRLYKKALNQSEIIDIMNATSPNSAPPIEQSKVDLVEEEKAVLFPNPNNGGFNLSFTLGSDQYRSFRMIDLSGKIVYEEEKQLFKAGNQLKSFDLTNLNNGYYTLQVLENDLVVSNHKLIINQ